MAAIPVGPNLIDISSNTYLNLKSPDPGFLDAGLPMTNQYIQEKKNRVELSRRLTISPEEIDDGNNIIHLIAHRALDIQGSYFKVK